MNFKGLTEASVSPDRASSKLNIFFSFIFLVLYFILFYFCFKSIVSTVTQFSPRRENLIKNLSQKRLLTFYSS
jgi:hypothetical protein